VDLLSAFGRHSSDSTKVTSVWFINNAPAHTLGTAFSAGNDVMIRLFVHLQPKASDMEFVPAADVDHV
jgi:hypothetical protein